MREERLERKRIAGQGNDEVLIQLRDLWWSGKNVIGDNMGECHGQEGWICTGTEGDKRREA
jgi:hypothetical protein